MLAAGPGCAPARADTGDVELRARLCALALADASAAQDVFFVSPVTEEGAVYVVWQQRRTVIIINARAPDLDAALADPRGGIDLTTDVVPTPDDVGGSTFLVDRGFVAGIVYGAAIFGRTFILDAQACASP